MAVNTSLSTAVCPLTWARARSRVSDRGRKDTVEKQTHLVLSDMQNRLDGSEGALTVFCFVFLQEENNRVREHEALLHWQQRYRDDPGTDGGGEQANEAHAHISCPM